MGEINQILEKLEIRLININEFGNSEYNKGWADAIKNVKYQIKKLKEKEVENGGFEINN